MLKLKTEMVKKMEAVNQNIPATTSPTATKTPTLSDVEPYVASEFQGAPVTPLTATYQAPDLPNTSLLGTNEAPIYKAPKTYTPSKDATVEGRMTGLLDSGSKYIRSARHRGMEEAQSRGLLNSSMAAGAAEKAAIESALPIVSQDAGAFHQAGMAGYEGKLKGALATQKYDADVGIIGAQTEGSSILSGQEAGQSAALTELDAGLKSGLSAQEAIQKGYQTAYDAAIASGLSKQEAEQSAILFAQEAESKVEIEQMQQAGAKERLQMEKESNEFIAGLELGAAEIENATRLVADLGTTYSDQVMRINADPGITGPNKTAIIADLHFQYQQSVDFVHDVYEVGIDWIDVATLPGEGDTTTTNAEQQRTQEATVAAAKRAKVVAEAAKRTGAHVSAGETIQGGLL